MDAGERGLVIPFDCGTEDELLDRNRESHTHIESIGLDHRYAEHPGGHASDYWDEHVQEALAQHARVFGVSVAD